MNRLALARGILLGVGVFTPTGLAQLSGGLEGVPLVPVACDGLADTVVGNRFFSGDVDALRWSESTGLVSLGDLPGYTSSEAVAVSRDGQQIIGRSGTTQSNETFLWTAAGMQNLSALGLPMHWNQVGADSTTFFIDPPPGGALPGYRWTTTAGLTPLQPPNSPFFSFLGCSHDGTYAVGHQVLTTVRPFLWSEASGFVDLGLLPGASSGGAIAVSDDGQVVVGTMNFGIGSTSVQRAFRWTSTTGLADLGALATGAESLGMLTNGDGSVVYGLARIQAPFGQFAVYRWTAASGLKVIAGNQEARPIDCNVAGDRVVGTSSFFNAAPGWRWTLGAEGYVGFTWQCGGGINSAGGVAVTRGTGVNLLSANRLTLHAEGLPQNSFGFFLASQSFVEPGVVPPGGQGALCLSGAIGRYVGPGQILNSGLAGTFSLPLDLTQMPTPQGLVAFMPGETWSFQAWFRDANPSTTSNFSKLLFVRLYF